MKTTIVTLPNGSTAVSFVPEDSRELAIVPLSVIQRLSKLLPTGSIQDTIATMQGKLDQLSNRHAMYNSTQPVTIEEYVNVLQEEIDFHATVNIIAEYQPAPLPEEYVEPLH